MSKSERGITCELCLEFPQKLKRSSRCSNKVVCQMYEGTSSGSVNIFSEGSIFMVIMQKFKTGLNSARKGATKKKKKCLLVFHADNIYELSRSFGVPKATLALNKHKKWLKNKKEVWKVSGPEMSEDIWAILYWKIWG